MKLTIHAGKKFSADFTVVSSDGVTPEELSVGDTAVFSLNSQGNNPACVLSPVSMTLVDTLNGLFNLSLTAEETSSLKQDIGFKEDKYSTLTNYIGFIDFVLVSGDRQATVDVYVREYAACPTA